MKRRDFLKLPAAVAILPAGDKVNSVGGAAANSQTIAIDTAGTIDPTAIIEFTKEYLSALDVDIDIIVEEAHI